jgi:hypothetical protein
MAFDGPQIEKVQPSGVMGPKYLSAKYLGPRPAKMPVAGDDSVVQMSKGDNVGAPAIGQKFITEHKNRVRHIPTF